MKELRLSLGLSLVCLAGGSLGAWGTCVEPIPIMHYRGVGPEAGAFDLSGTGYADKAGEGPAIRFWGYGSFAKANSGTQAQNIQQHEWLLHPAIVYKDKLPGAKVGHWVGYQMNWMGDGVVGCIRDAESARSVVEISFADPALEGTTRHTGRYVIVSVADDSSAYNLDRVHDAKGNRVIPVAPIPVPQVVAIREAKGTHQLVTVKLDDPVSYSEGGMNQPVSLVAGTRLYFVTGKEPTSSDPTAYKPVGDPASPDKELGLVPIGKSQVELSVPKADEPVWLVARVQYADPSATLLSNAVSSHARVAAEAGGGRERGERQRSR